MPKQPFFFYAETMNFSGTYAGAEDHFAAGLEELKRGVAALAANTSRPHKQLVQRGAFVYTTGNVLHRVNPATAAASPSLLSEIESAIAVGSSSMVGVNANGAGASASASAIDAAAKTMSVSLGGSGYGRWQDNEPPLERASVQVTAKVFFRPASSTIAQDVREVRIFR